MVTGRVYVRQSFNTDDIGLDLGFGPVKTR